MQNGFNDNYLKLSAEEKQKQISVIFPTAVASINIKRTIRIKESFALKAHFALSANSLCG